MTPQSSFLIVAPIRAGRKDELRELLAGMNQAPGAVDPDNDVIPFARFDRLHVARLLILEDLTLDDAAAHHYALPTYPPSLAFLGDCDGPTDTFLAELAARAEAGLRRLFSFCADFEPGDDPLCWMQDHDQPPAAMYVNWIGRTVRQIHEEHALRDALVAYAEANRAALAPSAPQEVRQRLIAHATSRQADGTVCLTPPAPTPLIWRVRDTAHLIGVPVALLLLAPVLLLYAPVYAIQLRARETTDPEIAPPPAPATVAALAAIEDRDVTNPFSAFGVVKPGRFRRWSVAFFLWLLDYASRHIFNRGRITRVRTIHFARWVFIDNGKRLLFASNYDGSLESYTDDFINKVAWGLNLVFSNGIGYPRTRWLLLDGAKDEQKFKYYIRRRQIPTDVWYKAYPGLTTVDIERNSRIRDGLARRAMSDAEIRDWLALL